MFYLILNYLLHWIFENYIQNWKSDFMLITKTKYHMQYPNYYVELWKILLFIVLILFLIILYYYIIYNYL